MGAREAIDTALAIRGLVRDGFAGTLGQFIAADPANIPESLRPYQAGYRRGCDLWARTGVVGNLVGGGMMNGMCDQYLGANAPVLSAATPAQFSGGQCPVRYVLNATINGTNPFSGNPFSSPYSGLPIGPCQGFQISPVPGSNNWIVEFRAAQGVTGQYLSSSRPTVSNISLARQDGQPDDCGSLPGEPEGYRPVTGLPPLPPTPPPYSPMPGVNIPINVGNLNFNVDGSIELNIDVGGISFNMGGGLPGTNAPEVPSGERPTIGGDPSDGEGDGEEDVPEIPGYRCIGVFMGILNAKASWGLIPDTGENEVYPRTVGNLSLKMEVDGTGGSYWGEDVQLHSRRTGLFRPSEGLTVVRWRCRIIEDCTYRITPVYIEDKENG